MRYLIAILIVLTVIDSMAQEVVVGNEIYFADMKLELSKDAQKKIQADVDNLRRNKQYFQKKVDLAIMYFPIIEKKFLEEQVPTDFKYLIIQESGFVSDAVSSSNAVGYWQFKEGSAKEVGLIVNSKVDERKNISASSRGAAKYLKNNNFHFNNWIYALQAYNQGAGGTKNDSETKYYGKKKMFITSKTHWYVLKFLAHKLAYENELNRESNMGLYLVEHLSKNTTLKKISNEKNVDFELLKDYNKWLSASEIPSDKLYTVLLPYQGKGTSTTTSNPEEKPTKTEDKDEMVTAKIEVDANKKEVTVKSGNNFPEIKIKLSKKNEKQVAYLKENPHVLAVINGLKVVRANKGDTKDQLALAGGITSEQLISYNDMQSFDPIAEGKFYYIQPKKTRSKVEFHIVKWNETLWQISQDYGVKLQSIRAKNRMDEFEMLKAGRILYLKKKRPKKTLVKHVDPGPKPEIEEKKEIKVSVKEIDKDLKKVVDEIKQTELKELPDLDTTKTIKEEVKIDLKNEGQEVLPNEDVEKRTDVLLHTVQQGETLFGIAKKYVTTVEQIMVWNNMKEPTIEIDQQLIVAIKDKEVVEQINDTEIDQKYVIHKVEQSESLFGIAKKYGVSVEQIMKLNNKQEPNINFGEELKIKAIQ